MMSSRKLNMAVATAVISSVMVWLFIWGAAWTVTWDEVGEGPGQVVETKIQGAPATVGASLDGAGGKSASSLHWSLLQACVSSWEACWHSSTFHWTSTRTCSAVRTASGNAPSCGLLVLFRPISTQPSSHARISIPSPVVVGWGAMASQRTSSATASLLP